jgi:hypothetical protein
VFDRGTNQQRHHWDLAPHDGEVVDWLPMVKLLIGRAVLERRCPGERDCGHPYYIIRRAIMGKGIRLSTVSRGIQAVLPDIDRWRDTNMSL